LYGCDDDSENAEQAAQAEVCDDLDALGESLAAVTDLGADSSRDDLEAVGSDVQGSLEDLRDSAGTVAEERFDDVEEAYDELIDYISNLPEDASFSEAFSGVVDRGTAVLTAVTAIFSDLGC
jgi:hypothetical protein